MLAKNVGETTASINNTSQSNDSSRQSILEPSEMPLKPIIFLQLLTYSQFVLREFGKDAISEPASMFPGQKSAKHQQTTDSNPSDAQEKAGGWKTSEVCTCRENTMLPCIAV